MEANKNKEHANEEKNFSFINKENNFSVPQNYFDYLPEEIMDKIRLESKPKQFFLLKTSIAISSLAVLAGIIILLVLFLNKEVIPSDDIILSENDVQQVIDNPELYNIDVTAITEQYLSSNVSDESMNNETNISDEEIKTYLEENSDVTNIINEL